MAARAELVQAAVLALMTSEPVALALAVIPTAHFVQVARHAYRSQGLDFSDDDIRNIHDGLKLMVNAAMKAQGGARPS
jgi:hypothetical protein